jgi:hypothetical protein
MRRLGFTRNVLTSCVAAVLLAGCGGSPPPIGAPVTLARNFASPSRATRGTDLLYISTGEEVLVYKFPDGKYKGPLGTFGTPDGLCTNTAGDIFVATASSDEVIVFPHGGTQPIWTLSSTNWTYDCSVNPTNNDVATTTRGSQVVIFPYEKRRGWRYGKTYSDPGLDETWFCGYDRDGNLFVDGETASGAFALTELPRGNTSFVNISLDQSISAPGSVLWDGKYMAVGDAGASPLVIYQFQVSASGGTEVGTTTLNETEQARQFWIQRGRVIAPLSAGGIGVWSYPSGGQPVQSFSGEPYAIAVSRPQ